MRDAAAVLAKSRELMNQADYEKLTSVETYLDEARRLKLLGVENSGVFGTACPKCYREISFAQERGDWQCHCDGAELNVGEVLNALGFSGFRHTTGSGRPL